MIFQYTRSPAFPKLRGGLSLIELTLRHQYRHKIMFEGYDEIFEIAPRNKAMP